MPLKVTLDQLESFYRAAESVIAYHGLHQTDAYFTVTEFNAKLVEYIEYKRLPEDETASLVALDNKRLSYLIHEKYPTLVRTYTKNPDGSRETVFTGARLRPPASSLELQLAHTEKEINALKGQLEAKGDALPAESRRAIGTMLWRAGEKDQIAPEKLADHFGISQSSLIGFFIGQPIDDQDMLRLCSKAKVPLFHYPTDPLRERVKRLQVEISDIQRLINKRAWLKARTFSDITSPPEDLTGGVRPPADLK